MCRIIANHMKNAQLWPEYGPIYTNPPRGKSTFALGFLKFLFELFESVDLVAELRKLGLGGLQVEFQVDGGPGLLQPVNTAHRFGLVQQHRWL